MDFTADHGRRGAAAILFLQAANVSMGVYSAVNSSPWTAETVTGGDDEKEKSLKRYCAHAIGQVIALNGMAALVAGSHLGWYVILGALVETAYMSWLYYDAVQRGRAKKASSFEENWDANA